MAGTAGKCYDIAETTAKSLADVAVKEAIVNDIIEKIA